jgi:hypothetical protein
LDAFTTIEFRSKKANNNQLTTCKAVKTRSAFLACRNGVAHLESEFLKTFSFFLGEFSSFLVNKKDVFD